MADDAYASLVTGVLLPFLSIPSKLTDINPALCRYIVLYCVTRASCTEHYENDEIFTLPVITSALTALSSLLL